MDYTYLIAFRTLVNYFLYIHLFMTACWVQCGLLYIHISIGKAQSWPQNVLMREQRFSFPMVLYRVLLTKTAIIWICLLFTNVNDATHCCWAIAKCQQCGVECIHTHIFKAFINYLRLLFSFWPYGWLEKERKFYSFCSFWRNALLIKFIEN